MRRRRHGLPPGYGRDRYKVNLKRTAPHSTDERQLSLDLWITTMLPLPMPMPERQVDLEDYLASLGEEAQP